MKAPLDAQCKWIIAVLCQAEFLSEGLWSTLEKAFGSIEYKGDFQPFEGTKYYQDEFGTGLYRGFIAFRGVDSPERLPTLKRAATALESALAQDGKRRFNFDIGYMDPDKVVLASYKRGPCKLYLGDGVYADLLLKYSQGCFEPLPWAFADFQDGRYQKSLLVIRQKLKSELRKVRPESREH